MIRNEALTYNTELPQLAVSEYGRILHNYITYICGIEDREKRTQLAHTLIYVMENLNPSVKNEDDYKHKLWDYMHVISDYKLDVDGPFTPPTKENANIKPEHIPYPTKPIRYKFYGRNLQYMIDKAAETEDEELKAYFVNILANYMKGTARVWNNEEINEEMIVKHMNSMSDGKLDIEIEDLDLTSNSQYNRRSNNQHKNNRNYKKHKIKKSRNSRH